MVALARLREEGLACLGEAGAALGDVLAVLAPRVVDGRGRFSHGLADALQGPAFRLVELHAGVEAARAALLQPGAGDLELALGCLFCGEVLARCREVLPRIGGQLGGVPPVCAAFCAGRGPGELAAQLDALAFWQQAWELLDAQPPARPADGGLSSEHVLLRQAVRSFAEQQVRPQAERLHREDALLPEELLEGVAALGCFGLSIPARYGGLQERPDSLGMVLATEELSRGSLIAGSLITRPEILARALLQGGCEEQLERLLPPLARGQKMASVAVTEPDHGSDVAGLRLRARPVDGGWRLNGEKLWSTFAGRAELLGVLARSHAEAGLGPRGLSLFVVEKPPFREREFRHAPAGRGTLQGRAIATLGYRGMHSYALHFEEYFVPAENLAGGEQGLGRGFALQLEGFTHGRLQTAGRALGVMQAALELAHLQASTRKAFGKPLSAFQLTRERLLQMHAALQASRQAAYATARLLNEGRGQQHASLAKLLCCHNAEWVTRNTQQLHGGLGYAEECAASRLFVDARVLSIFEGTTEVLALRVLLPALLQPFL